MGGVVCDEENVEYSARIMKSERKVTRTFFQKGGALRGAGPGFSFFVIRGLGNGRLAMKVAALYMKSVGAMMRPWHTS
jgi:hypothetical protein